MLSAVLLLAPLSAAEQAPPYLLHLSGVGGPLRIDHNMIRGLVEGGFAGEIEVHDWTRGDPGFHALRDRQRNLAEAQWIADQLTERYRADPQRRIYITSHSGGTGIAVWALERLPEDVQIEAVLMMMSALSPDYDLSEALRRVRRSVSVFWSEDDAIVLGAGTRVMGTIDGIHSDAAGRVGFNVPETADPQQYEKLVLHPYDPAWVRLDNIGDHIGPMTRTFAREYLAPLVLTGRPPQVQEGAALPNRSTD